MIRDLAWTMSRVQWRRRPFLISVLLSIWAGWWVWAPLWGTRAGSLWERVPHSNVLDPNLGACPSAWSILGGRLSEFRDPGPACWRWQDRHQPEASGGLWTTPAVPLYVSHAWNLLCFPMSLHAELGQSCRQWLNLRQQSLWPLPWLLRPTCGLGLA